MAEKPIEITITLTADEVARLYPMLLDRYGAEVDEARPLTDADRVEMFVRGQLIEPQSHYDRRRFGTENKPPYLSPGVTVREEVTP